MIKPKTMIKAEMICVDSERAESSINPPIIVISMPRIAIKIGLSCVLCFVISYKINMPISIKIMIGAAKVDVAKNIPPLAESMFQYGLLYLIKGILAVKFRGKFRTNKFEDIKIKEV
ncbi:hypothetical protein ACFSTH_18245 [Paenibacillus yanchengensis]